MKAKQNDNETFKVIPFATKYEVSRNGIVRNRQKSKRLIKICVDNIRCGVKPFVHIRVDKASKKDTTILLETIVGETFVEKDLDSYKIIHFDNDIANNRADNLLWLNKEDECKYYYRLNQDELPIGVTLDNLNSPIGGNGFKVDNPNDDNIYYRKYLNEAEQYIIDTYGNIFSLYTNRFIKAHINSKGFGIVTLTKDGKSIQYRVNRLVIKNFTRDNIKGKLLSFIDGNKTNTHISNIKYKKD